MGQNTESTAEKTKKEVTVSFFEASRIQRNIFSKSARPLKNVNFCLSSRKAIILTTGIH